MRWWGMLLVLACSGKPLDGTTVRMEYAALADDFYAAPFPSETRLVDGIVSLAGFPNPRGKTMVEDLLDVLSGATGFGTTSTIYLTTTQALDSSVEAEPDPTRSWDSGVLLVGLDDPGSSPHPVEVQFREDGGPYGSPNLLSILPLQGRPLEPNARYAAVVRTRVVDAAGQPLVRSAAIRSLERGRTPEGMSDGVGEDYRSALNQLASRGVDDVAGLAVFRTWDPAAEMAALRDAIIAEPPEVSAPFNLVESFDAFCVFESVLPMPVYQAGDPPFSTTGGQIEFAEGIPQRVGTEDARIVVTIPRLPMPADGYPLVIFARTGGGGDRPLVDRGVRAVNGGPAIEAGSGPARDFARVGWAGVSVDGPHGGLRNVTGNDSASLSAEQTRMFNLFNLGATRDNVRQSAAELALVAHVVETLEFDASACDAASPAARFDTTTLTLMGHSMGATIGPLTLAVEPRVKAVLLSGAGGSWIENIVHKLLPLPVRPPVQLALGLTASHPLHEHEPTLMLLQWGGEPADPPVYAEAIRENGTHVLMMQGMVDRYILPPIANSLSIALHLDLGGEPLDDTNLPDIEGFAPLESRLVFSDGQRVELPTTGHQSGQTRVVVQHAQGLVEDGHEVVFQLDEPKHQYRCFLQTLATGTPTVPAPGACP